MGELMLKWILILLMPSPNLIAAPKIATPRFPELTKVKFMNVMFLPKAILTKKYAYQYNVQTSK
jgi:hypothetical protein